MKLQTSRILGAIFILAIAGHTAFAQRSDREPNFDRRAVRGAPAARAGVAPSQQGALAQLRAELGGSLVDSIDGETGVTSSLYHATGYLTEPAGGDASDVALAFVRSNVGLLGLQPSDLRGYEITDNVYTEVTGATHLYLRQRYLGLPVYNAQLQVHINRDGRIIAINNAFVPGVAALGKSATPATSAAQAVASAAQHLGTPLTRSPRIADSATGARQRTRVEARALSNRDVDAELMWLPVGRDLKLVWNFQLHTPDGQHIYDMNVDAERGSLANDHGDRVFTRFDWVSPGTYRVYRQPVESPNHTSPLPPADAREIVVNPERADASPQGWFSGSGATIMDGNNVHAYLDRNGNNAPDSPQPTCASGPNGPVCDFSINLNADPSNFTSAAIANLFYWNNIIHDVQYQYGFDEAGGNFQENNFGRGGNGSDSVNAEAQDNANGSSRCNANFATPTDGGNPRMQMFVCNNSSPQRDGDLDNGVIVHEYGHGISIRQVGGPGNSSCLSNRQQGGEGWSDWFALAYTADAADTGSQPRGVGSYLFGLPTDGSIRPQRYSTNPSINNYTYESINGLSVPHGVGSVWAQAIWEVYWALVTEYGFSTDLYDATGGAGNQRAMLYVNEGLKNTACSPTFVAARNGIIQAATDNFSGADVCRVWQAFADFGLGVNAVSGGSNSTNPSNGFDLPTSCTTPTNTPPAVNITAPPNGSTSTVGDSVTFSGTSNDVQDGDISAGLNWSSSINGAIGNGASFSTSALNVGTHTITASSTDSGGLTGTDTITVTVNSGGPGCSDCIDWNATATVAYSNQDAAGTVTPQDGGSTLFMQGNRWRRTTQTFNVTPTTVIEFDFMSTSQGEIHGIGFDEDDTLTNDTRIVEIFGTQGWGGAFQFANKYTVGELGAFRSFRIEIGQFYTGTNMFLVLVNDKDAGAGTNTSSFRNVRVFEEAPPSCGTVLHSTDFESGASGWTHDAGSSTCSTGNWGVGNPTGVTNGGVTTQLEDDHTAAGVNAFFTAPNTSAGVNDVDNGVCTALSPTIDAGSAASAEVTVWYYHGQRDAGDDAAGDFFRIDVSTDNGVTFPTSLVSTGDVTSNASWTQLTATVNNPGQLRLRVQASDGAGPGDLVEGGIDDVLVCATTSSR